MSFCFIGTKRTIETARTFIAERRIPHAILIEGEQGTGRHKLAHFIANAAVCTEITAPCGKCRNCLLSASGNHPDILLVSLLKDKKSITVNQIREIRGSAYVRAHMGGRKVIIIENAESMNEQAQNALLKVLEEPPKNVIFILITENASMLLCTIVSRCTVFSLSAPQTSEAADYLRHTTNADIDTIIETLKMCRNNIGRALEFLAKKGKTDDIASAFAENLISGRSAYELLKTSYPLEKNRVKCQEFVDSLKLHLTEEMRSHISKGLSVERLVKYYDILTDAEPSLETNINISLFLNALVCKLCSVH